MIVIDYSSLASDIKKIADAAQLNDVMQQFETKIKSIESEIESLAPNMKATDR